MLLIAVIHLAHLSVFAYFVDNQACSFNSEVIIANAGTFMPYDEQR